MFNETPETACPFGGTGSGSKILENAVRRDAELQANRHCLLVGLYYTRARSVLVARHERQSVRYFVNNKRFGDNRRFLDNGPRSGEDKRCHLKSEQREYE
jgi:hypothetical protein